MAKLQDRLEAGLEAQGWLQTRSRCGTWNRWAKFGRGAYYVILFDVLGTDADDVGAFFCQGELWWSELHKTAPSYKVVGPIREQVLLAGDAWLAERTPDTQALLIELLDLADEQIHRDGGEDED